MPNAVEILSTTLVEYPKNPTTGRLIKVFGPAGQLAVGTVTEITADNSCLCLLGHVGVAGDVDPKALDSYDYAPLFDGNGIEEAIVFLARAISEESAARVLGSPQGEGERSHAARLKGVVYDYNDDTLVLVNVDQHMAGAKPVYTEKSVAKVTAKIQQALDLAKKAAAVAEIEAAQEAVKLALTENVEDSNAVKVLQRAAVEYPKNPVQHDLVRKLDSTKPLSPDNACMCLLGNLAYSGGVAPQTIETARYEALRDDNGIQEAVRLLATVINPTRAAEIAKTTYKDYDNIVFHFNDTTLRETASSRAPSPKYTPESVYLVVAKIHEAIALGRQEQAEQREAGKVSALKLAGAVLTTAKGLVA